MGQFVPTDGRGVQKAASFALNPAGAESNVAMGLARLGHAVMWASRLGNDAIGRRIRSEIERAGVDMTLLRTEDGHPSGIFLKDPGQGSSAVSYYRRGSAASHMDRSDIDNALKIRPRVLHLSGITPALSTSCEDAIQYALEVAGASGVTTSFDVNYRPGLWRSRDAAAEKLLELANASRIVFVGLDEAESLWGTETVEEVRRAIPRARTLVVKDGAHRAVAFEAGRVTSAPALRVDVVEAVGAGDAFAAGYLNAFLHGFDHSTALRSGHLMARAALMSLSDQGEHLSSAALGLLARDESLWSVGFAENDAAAVQDKISSQETE
jgi:2-dehydro-3-deoxygluconokinase